VLAAQINVGLEFERSIRDMSESIVTRYLIEMHVHFI